MLLGRAVGLGLQRHRSGRSRSMGWSTQSKAAERSSNSSSHSTFICSHSRAYVKDSLLLFRWSDIFRYADKVVLFLSAEQQNPTTGCASAISVTSRFPVPAVSGVVVERDIPHQTTETGG